MSKTLRWMPSAVLLGTFLCMPFGTSAAPSRHRSLADDQLTRFTTDLAQHGFDVSRGAAGHYNPAAQWCSGDPQFQSAMYFSNEPYVVMVVPESGQLGGDFQLRPDEAVVVIGLTPPAVKYFAYTPYVNWKVYPDATRRVLATFGDGLNNATIQTTGKTPFDAPVALVFTPDKRTDAEVRAALRRAGYPAAIINTIVLPTSMLTLGHGDAADRLLLALRMAIPVSPDAVAAYVEEPPLDVFRVTPHDPATPDPFPVPPLRIRGTGQTEMDLMDDLDRMRESIIEEHSPLYTATDLTPRPICNEGNDLTQRGIEVCGDNRDAFYVASGWIYGGDDLTLTEDEFLIIYGVNHLATGKATYMNVNIYAGEDAHLTVGHVDDRQFPTGSPLYTYKVSRKPCGDEPRCLQLTVEDCPRFTLDDRTLLGVFTRIYLEPATKLGPAMPEIIYDRAIKFSPRTPAPQQ